MRPEVLNPLFAEVDSLDGVGPKLAKPLEKLGLTRIKEITYHLRYSSEWMIRLGDGTEVSQQKMQTALNDLWRYSGEVLMADEIDQAAVRIVRLGAPSAPLPDNIADRVDVLHITRTWRFESAVGLSQR